MWIKTPDDFSFVPAVCSHGFFVLAPNLWDPAAASLRTTIALDDRTAVGVTVSTGGGKVGRINIRPAGPLSAGQGEQVRRAVRRMLRLDEDLTPFHELCRSRATHRRAADIRFGRLLRGASLFEDVVKVICTCNTTWRQTVNMTARIVEAWGVPADDAGSKAFPTAERLARVNARSLKARARVGYRAEFISRFARQEHEGELDLDAFESFAGPGDELHRQLRQIPGVGDYAASHLCMLLGHYGHLAIDTEMRRFFRERHPGGPCSPADIRACYAEWHPYQFLAYWYELWDGYVERHGQSDQWSASDTGARITARARSAT